MHLRRRRSIGVNPKTFRAVVLFLRRWFPRVVLLSLLSPPPRQDQLLASDFQRISILLTFFEQTLRLGCVPRSVVYPLLQPQPSSGHHILRCDPRPGESSVVAIL